MNEQRRFGLNLSWLRISTVFVIDVAVLALVSNLPQSWQTDHIAWWVGVGVAVIVTLAALITYRKVPLASALFGLVSVRFADPETILQAGRTPAVDHQRRFSRQTVGVREYDGRLVTVIAIDSPDDVASGRHRQWDVSAPELPLDIVGAGVREFDVRLDAIDVVSVETRHASEWDDAVAWDNPESASQRAPVVRRTWMVLRMDPQRNAAAIAARDSVASTMAAVTERLVTELEGRRCPARPVTAADFEALDIGALAGLQPSQVRPRRRRLKHQEPNGFVTSFWVSPQDITSETLQELWLPDADVTVLTLRFTVGRSGPEVAAWVRYHSAEPLSKEASRGLNRLTGRQLAAVCASMPTPAHCPSLVVPSRHLGDDEELILPVSSAAKQQMTPVGGS